MKQIAHIAIVAILAVVPACASGGRQQEVVEGAEALRAAPSVYALIGDREELELTSSQIAALDSIGEWLTRANSPLEDQLGDMGVSSLGFSERGRGRAPEEAQPLIEQLRANNERATAAIGEQLTAEQKASVCEVRRPRPRGGDRRATREEEARADSLTFERRGRWDWCPAATPAA